MSDQFRQDKRVAKLNTPLGQDKLVLVDFECTEGVSEKFEIKINAISKDKNLNFDTAIGQSCTVTVKDLDSSERYFDGVLTQARWIGGDEKEHRYHLVLRPWLWLASFRRNCLIFHDMRVPDIVNKVLADYGHAPIDNLSRDYPQLEYCVQYRETDMDFVCRLMEEYGISYYFRHADGHHDMVLTDEMSTFESLPGGSRPYIPHIEQGWAPGPYFFSFVPERQFTSGKVKLDDYDFENSTTDLALTEEINPPFDPGSLEVFDYPGRYVKSADGQKIAQAWRDMERSNDGHYHSEGACVATFPGALVTIDDQSDSGLGAEYLALRCYHRFGGQAYRSTAGADEGQYVGRYEFIKSDRTYAPPRVTKKAVINGPQTAKVIGEDDIDVDKYGRILVQFHWDQKKDQSRRCRVAQVWAGNGWGGIYTPRVGMEVIVAFLEGDPDHPLVVGTVYNDKHMPPFDLPGGKAVSGLKSNSTPSGNGYNEFVFDDSGGGELVRLHAQKDLDSVVEQKETRNVKIDRKSEIGQNDTLDVGQTLKIVAGMKVEITVGQSKITMTQAGIKIEGIMLESKGTAMLKTSAPIAQHNGDGMMTIKGGIVMIN